MDNERLAKLIADLYNVVDGLDQLFAGCNRRFTPDGHLVGSIGEAVAKHIYDMELEPSSRAGWDAILHSGEKVQIKTTSVASISLRSAGTYADSLLVLKMDRKNGFREIYAGRFPKHLLDGREPDGRGYFSLSLAALGREHSHTFAQKRKLDDLNRHFLQERNG